MQLFVISHGFADAGLPTVGRAIRAAASRFPAIAHGGVQEGTSKDGVLAYATVGHPDAVSAPRRYVARSADEVVVYDGLPIDRLDAFPASAAGELLARWDELPDRLEGMFCAVRIDLADATVECLTDSLGMAPVYLHRGRGRWVLGNSVEAVGMAAGLSAPHPVGVPSLLTLGWPVSGSTLIAGVDKLPGGHVHELGAAGLRSRPHFTPALAVPRRSRQPRPAADVAAAMVRTARAAARDVDPLVCGVTAGRDSRVLMALARRAEWEATFYTSGEDGDVDVEVARELTGRLGLPYRVATPEVMHGADWAAATAQFVGQTDGMATMVRIGDWLDHQAPARRLGVKLWGAGGEIGRGGAVASLAIPVAANMWGLRWAPAAQRWVLRRKPRAWDLFRPGVVEATAQALDRFVDARRHEGWRARELLEAYNAFERVPHWASAGLRRAASSTDLFSPFVSKGFIDWCFSLPAPQRVVEAPHWRLLSELAPDLRDMPFERPWRPQRPRWAQAMIVGDAAKTAAGRVRRRTPTTPARPGFASRWLDAGREASRELCLSHHASPLWDLVDRRSLEAVLAQPFQDQRRPADYWLAVCGTMTAFWWFHGRESAVPAIAEAA